MKILPIILTILLAACAPREVVEIRTDTLKVPVPVVAETVRVFEYQHPIWTWAGEGAKVESVYVNVPGKTVYVKTRPDTIKVIDTDTVRMVIYEKPKQTILEYIQERSLFILLGIAVAMGLMFMIRFK